MPASEITKLLETLALSYEAAQRALTSPAIMERRPSRPPRVGPPLHPRKEDCSGYSEEDIRSNQTLTRKTLTGSLLRASKHLARCF
jgi:hypothetical protein